ncbi:hypothetical protein M3Y94_00342300 [Aphelenchoides besseyi]|nr:hypothetical protein M3Y94_00342300 [Aphelenchoides besseyi]KAI6235430.1 Josephin-like protein [Aphelenchoides besseyi]
MSELQRFYHERQRRQFCLLHTLNNLFEREEFRKEELDQICEVFDSSVWFNAHRSMLGLGNYDVNILLRALESRGLEGVWFDKRLSAKEINHSAVHSYIFNVPSDSYLSFLRNGRHWFAVKRFGSNFYNLDSKLLEPAPIHDFTLFANEKLARNDEMFIVCRPEDRNKILLSGEAQNN